MFKFGLGIAVGIVIAPAVTPLLVRKLDELDLKLRVRAAQARDRGHTSHTTGY